MCSPPNAWIVVSIAVCQILVSVRGECPAWSDTDDDVKRSCDVISSDSLQCEHDPVNTLEGAFAQIKDLRIMVSIAAASLRRMPFKKTGRIADFKYLVCLIFTSFQLIKSQPLCK